MTKKLIELVEALRTAGQRGHGYNCAYDGRAPESWCDCGVGAANAQVDAAAKALVAEIEGKKNCLSAEEKLASVLEAVNPVMEKFYSDAEGEKEWATFQDAIQHLGDVVDGIGDPE
jgi:peptide deformylase